jgi:hypothetical protein
MKEQCCQPNVNSSLYSSGGSWWWSSGASGGNVACTVVCSVLGSWTGVVLLRMDLSSGDSLSCFVCRMFSKMEIEPCAPSCRHVARVSVN